MLNKPVLVLGSKPGSKIPTNIDFKDVYTANGAAERGMHYKKLFSLIHHFIQKTKTEFTHLKFHK